MLQVVVDELLDNAWKFTAAREAPFVEFGEEQTQDGSQVFFVRDNGIGFDMMYAHKLFRNFEQLHLPGTYEEPGWGWPLCSELFNATEE